MSSKKITRQNRQRSLSSFKRNEIAKRKPYDVVLIVCEGKETEPNYLKAMCEAWKLNPANIKIRQYPLGSDPKTIVNYTLSEFNKYKDYDRLFCVFDKEYTNYPEALNIVKDAQKNDIKIDAITSVPCFEYWILLHYIETSKPYRQSGKKSPADQVISALKTKGRIPDYSKAHKNIYEATKNLLDDAIIRSKRIDKQQMQQKTDNPSTKVYLLVEYLRNINNRDLIK